MEVEVLFFVELDFLSSESLLVLSDESLSSALPSTLALFNAALVAPINPAELNVAPETASTFVVCSFTIRESRGLAFEKNEASS